MTGKNVLSNLGKWINVMPFIKIQNGTEFMEIKNNLGLSKVESQDYMISVLVLSLIICVTLNQSLNLQAVLCV